MWDEIIVQLLYTDHSKRGVTPPRHELAARAYSEKIRAMHEAEQRAATPGVVTKAMSRLWARTKALFATMQPRETPAARTGAEYPAE